MNAADQERGDDVQVTGRPSPLEARLREAEEQCMFERTKRIELAALVAGFIQRAVPLIQDAGISLDLEVSP